MKRDYHLCHGNGAARGLSLASGLGWFNLALRALELVATRELTRSLGMRGSEPLVRLYGLREIATEIGILLSPDPTPWIWGRVVGDALDIGTLAAHANDENPEEGNVTIALGNVALVTAVDLYCGHRLSETAHNEVTARDYTDPSGISASSVV